jgi:hypothetical protein
VFSQHWSSVVNGLCSTSSGRAIYGLAALAIGLVKGSFGWTGDMRGQFYDCIRFRPVNHPQLHDDRAQEAIDRSIDEYAPLLAR